MTMARSLLLGMCALAALVAYIPVTSTRPVGRPDNSPTNTQLLYSDEIMPSRTPCFDDSDCVDAAGHYCFRKTTRQGYCKRCMDCEEHRRKPGWVSCVRQLTECSGACIDGYFGHSCVHRVEDYLDSKGNGTEAGDYSPSIVVASISFAASTLVVIVVVVLLVAGFQQPKYRALCCTASHQLKDSSGYELQSLHLQADGDSDSTPQSSSPGSESPQPTAPIYPRPLAYNPQEEIILPRGAALAAYQGGVAYPGGFNDSQPRPEEVHRDGGRRFRRVAHDSRQQALPYERGHSSGSRTDHVLADPHRYQLADLTPGGVGRILVDDLARNPPAHGVQPNEDDGPGLLSEESYDLTNLDENHHGDAGLDEGNRNLAPVWADDADDADNEILQNVDVNPVEQVNAYQEEHALLSPDRLTPTEMQLFGIDGSIYFHCDIHLSVSFPFTTRSQIRLPALGRNNIAVVQHLANVEHHQQPERMDVDAENENNQVVPEYPVLNDEVSPKKPPQT